MDSDLASAEAGVNVLGRQVVPESNYSGMIIEVEYCRAGELTVPLPYVRRLEVRVETVKPCFCLQLVLDVRLKLRPALMIRASRFPRTGVRYFLRSRDQILRHRWKRNRQGVAKRNVRRALVRFYRTDDRL